MCYRVGGFLTSGEEKKTTVSMCCIMADFFRSIFGPKLYYLYRNRGIKGYSYDEVKLEAYSSKTITCLGVSWSICMYLSPIVLTILYRRGLLTTPDGTLYLMKVSVAVAGLYYLAHITRGIGRFSNPNYRKFLEDIHKSSGEHTKYDFSFSHWPVDFISTAKVARTRSKNNVTIEANIFVRLLSYIASSSFARWLIYPGSTTLINMAIEPALIDGRRKLVEDHNGKRHKLQTVDGNHIDTMFIDNRGEENGDILVITSEGNAAFYEAGCMDAPLERKYSILGWNHPGFGASSGKPYPDQEHAAMDAVIQFALEKLKFKIERIVFFSWSIGGFSSTWAAANYPQCRALILDATFDDILPLARNRMPAALDKVTEYTVRAYFDLDNIKWLNQYKGPVKLIRRTDDEMISTDPSDIRTNRGNNLLIELLNFRYPHLATEASIQKLSAWLTLTGTRKETMMNEFNVKEDECVKLMKKVQGEGDDFPSEIGQSLEEEDKTRLMLFLADKHLVDMKSTHCVPLPAGLFEMPWELK